MQRVSWHELFRAVACRVMLQQHVHVLQIYEGEVEPWLMSDYCTDTVPVLLRRATFCRAFAADAKDFRSYNSWVGALTSPQQLPLYSRLCLAAPLDRLLVC